MKRLSITGGALLAVWILMMGIAQNLKAQPYPSRSIELIVTMDPDPQQIRRGGFSPMNSQGLENPGDSA